ncbi:3-oxo-tetronate kinase [Roseiarcus sp.]|uniref:3-oxo-tetronate kinase n=1 Tax=Roseiarcus sp. TaxID=1969460 RepID=UPI003F9E35A7
MPLILGAVADDYTGASDLANTLSRNGLSTIQTIGVPAAGFEAGEVDAIVVALKIRSVEAPSAVAAATAGYDWLMSRGARHVVYKICSTFDSTDSGNIGPVGEAFRARAGAGCVMVTPAFPETGRTVYLGHLFVGDVPLNESPLKDHPLNPMRDSNLVRVLKRQSKAPVGLVALPTVAEGGAAIMRRLAELDEQGIGAAIVDAVFERDLETIGEAAAQGPVSVGASGLGLGLARAFARGRGAGASAALEPVGGLAAILAGSCSRATLDQVAAAEGGVPTLRLSPQRLIEDTSEAECAVAWAKDRLAAGPVLIASSAEPGDVAALQARFGREASGHAIEAALAEIAAGLVGIGVRRLIVAGGETAGAAVDRLGVRAFRLGPEIAPGVPLMRTIGRDDGEMQVALKSGNFGGRDFFARALAMTR